MHISPINSVTTAKTPFASRKQNPNFMSAASKVNKAEVAVKTGFLASVAAFFKGVKELFSVDDEINDLPASDMDVEMDIKTGRDMIP